MSTSKTYQNSALMKLAEGTIAQAKGLGAQDASATASRGREVALKHRDGALESIRESSSASLSLGLYVDGRFSSHSTSDLRPEALTVFVERAVAMTRLLNEDPARTLADPALYEGRSDVDLALFDEGYDAVDTAKRQDLAARIETGARAVEAPIISVTGEYEDARRESVRVHSNGFVGAMRKTSYAMSVDVSLEDPSGSKPSDWDWVSVRHVGDLLSPDELGARGAKRAVGRLGQTTLPSARMPRVVENRAARTLFRYLLQAFNGSMLQQDRSFLKGKLGERIASDVFTLTDEPLIPRGLGSRYWDGDGITSKPRTLVEAGTLREYLINVYYANKMDVAPTGGGTSNLVLAPGEKSSEELVKDVQKGIFVTSL